MKVLEMLKKGAISIACGVFAILFCGMAVSAEGDVPGELYETDEDVIFAEIEETMNSKYITSEETSSLPSRVDLSQDVYFPPIGQQYGGSCMAWATTYYQFTYEVARYMAEQGVEGWEPKYDSSKIFSPKFVWNFKNCGIGAGVSAESCYEVLSDFGCVKWTQFPHTDDGYEWYEGTTEEETRECLKEALEIRLSSYQQLSYEENPENASKPAITSVNSESIRPMKELLNEGHPLNVTTHILSFRTITLPNWGTVCISKEGENGAHAMTIVGYDDTICYDLNGDKVIQEYEKGAFKVANSWGEDSDNDGFIWIMYDALNVVSNADRLQEIEDREPVFENCCYRTIEVQKYENNLMVEVNVEQAFRGEMQIALGVSNEQKNVPQMEETCISEDGYWVDFNGNSYENAEYDTRMLIFSYDELYQSEDDVYWIQVSDAEGDSFTALTTVKEVTWFDASGKVIKKIGEQKPLSHTSAEYNSYMPFEVSVKTGIVEGTMIQSVINSMSESGYSFTAYNYDNSIISSPTTTKAGTGMKIIKRDLSNGSIVTIYYIVLYGDVTGTGTVGDGLIDANDSLSVQKYSGKMIELGELALLAGDVNHDGEVNILDAQMILQDVGSVTVIEQNYEIIDTPIECFDASEIWMNKSDNI